MSSKSGIEWTNATWNPLTGCTQVSPGCTICYAMVLHNRRHAVSLKNDGRWTPGGKAMPPQYARPFSEVQLFPDRLETPLHWKKPRMIFVNSVSDLFHKDVPATFILDVFETMAKADHHIYQVLTKRPHRLVQLVPAILDRIGGVWPEHILIGVSCESQDYTWRVDKLREVPAPTLFISAEPLLGAITFNLKRIAWVIAGAESGSGARPMDEEWVRLIRDQCLAQKVAFYYKQNAIHGKKVSLPQLDGQVWQQIPPVEEQFVEKLKEQEAIQYIESVTKFEVQTVTGEGTVSVRTGAYLCRKNNAHGSRWFVEATRGEALQEAKEYVTQDQIQCGCTPDEGSADDTRG